MPVYLYLDGLTGGVTSKDFPKYMSVSSYSWGFTVPVNTSGGVGSDRQGAGKVQAGELHVVKKQDTSTVDLMQKSFGGTPFATAKLVVTRVNQGGEDKMLEYNMTNVILSSFTTSGSDGGDQPMEQMSLHFTKIDINQYQMDATGKVKTPTRAGYDFEKMTKA